MLLRFFTIMRTFVTGVSGAPLSAVVLSVPSSAGAPLASKATAASVNGMRFSIKLSVACCALTQKALHSRTKLIANIFMAPPSHSADDRVDEIVNRLPIFRNALPQTSFQRVTGFFQHARRCAIPSEHVRVYTTDIVVCKCVVRHRN